MAYLGQHIIEMDKAIRNFHNSTENVYKSIKEIGAVNPDIGKHCHKLAGLSDFNSYHHFSINECIKDAEAIIKITKASSGAKTFPKDIYSKLIRMADNAFILKNKYFELMKGVLVVRDRVRNLAVELGINAKPELKLLTVEQRSTDPSPASYSSSGEMKLVSSSLAREPGWVELYVAHEFAHGMQPLAAKAAYMRRSQIRSYADWTSSQICGLAVDINKTINKYRAYLDSDLKRLGIKPPIEYLTRIDANFICNNALCSLIWNKPNFGVVENGFLTCMREFSKHLKILNRILSFKAKKEKSEQVLNALYNIKRMQRRIAKLGNETHDIFTDIIKRKDEIVAEFLVEHVTEGFASVIQYLYGKKYNIPMTEQSISKGYLPVATRAYTLYCRNPNILKGVFTGMGSSAKDWGLIKQRLGALRQEFSSIDFVAR